MLQIDEAFDGQTIDVQVGQEFEVRLQENRTTGFRWEVRASGEPACMLLSDFFEAPEGPPGRPGFHHWRFRAQAIARGYIELAYSRPWQQHAAPAQIFTLAIRVTQQINA